MYLRGIHDSKDSLYLRNKLRIICVDGAGGAGDGKLL